MKTILIFASGVVLGAVATALSRKNNLYVLCTNKPETEGVTLLKMLTEGLDDSEE